MVYKYTFYSTTNHGRTFRHKRCYKTVKNARAAVDELIKRAERTGNAVTSWQIINWETGEIEEASE